MSSAAYRRSDDGIASFDGRIQPLLGDAYGLAYFKDLVGRVCLGEVGAIYGLEISRLARSSADLSRLLELARVTDTLVVDSDGI